MTRTKRPGVYAIVHAESSRLYVGSTNDIRRRWRLHRSELRRGVHHCRHLQNAWRKYGEPAFAFRVLEVCFDDEVVLRAREQHWLDAYRESLFNASATAQPNEGKPVQEHVKRLLSDRMKGNRRGAGHYYCGGLTERQVLVILYRYASGVAAAVIAAEFGVTTATVTRIGARKIWRNVPLPADVETARAARAAAGNHHASRAPGRIEGLPPAEKERIRTRRAAGESYASIARSYGTTGPSVRDLLKKTNGAAETRTVFTPPEEPAVTRVALPAPPRRAKRPARFDGVPYKPRPERVEVCCSTCGAPFNVPPYRRAAHKDLYCGKECRRVGNKERNRLRMSRPETREHLAALNRGKKASPETRAKMSASHRAKFITNKSDK